MSLRIRLVPLLLLAACSESRGTAEAKPDTAGIPVGVLDTGRQVRAPEPDPQLPDFADPRLFLDLDSLR